MNWDETMFNVAVYYLLPVQQMHFMFQELLTAIHRVGLVHEGDHFCDEKVMMGFAEGNDLW